MSTNYANAEMTLHRKLQQQFSNSALVRYGHVTSKLPSCESTVANIYVCLQSCEVTPTQHLYPLENTAADVLTRPSLKDDVLLARIPGAEGLRAQQRILKTMQGLGKSP
jgi:hypothetical protein